jgi:hypothetical protein
LIKQFTVAAAIETDSPQRLINALGIMHWEINEGDMVLSILGPYLRSLPNKERLPRMLGSKSPQKNRESFANDLCIIESTELRVYGASNRLLKAIPVLPI